MVILGTMNYAHEVNGFIYLKLSLINSVNKTITENNHSILVKGFYTIYWDEDIRASDKVLNKLMKYK